MEVIMKRLLLPIMAALLILPIFGENQLKNVDPSKVICLLDIHGTVVEKDSGKRFKMGLKTAWHMLRSRTARNIYQDYYHENGFCAGEAVERKYHELAQEYLEDAQFVLAYGHNKLAARLTEKEQIALNEAAKQINQKSKNKYEKKAKWYHKRAKKARKGKNKELAKKYHKKAARLIKLAHLFHNFELSYNKMDGILELLNALKSRGYTQHYVASNIGVNHYEIMKKKFPEIFNDNMLQDGLVVNPCETPILKKPDHLYFKKAQMMFNPGRDKVLVFIDDKQENVDAANNCGMIGILTKDVKYLVNQLNIEGLDLTYGKRKVCKNGKRHTAIQIA